MRAWSITILVLLAALSAAADVIRLKNGRTIWADQVRDSRNVLHYQSQPAMANTYEKVAALLIGAVPYMRTIYTVLEAAKQLALQVSAPSTTAVP